MDMRELTQAELLSVAEADVVTLLRKQTEYGPSWKRRGGVGAFMMLARKWDRLEEQVKRDGYDIFASCANDTRPEGILDDIADLRRYLLLVEAQVMLGRVPAEYLDRKDGHPGICEYEGCGRVVLPGSRFCAAHYRGAVA